MFQYDDFGDYEAYDREPREDDFVAENDDNALGDDYDRADRYIGNKKIVIFVD